MNIEDIERKLSAARTRLIIDKPFLGALSLRLPLQAASSTWCETTATDARKFYYNPEYIEQLSLSQTQFILAHEALHCALSHFARRQHRVKQRWDIACDYAVNPLLVNDGLSPPPGALLEDSFRGMTAEEIYPFIEENPDECTLDKHLYDNREDGGQRDSNPSENAQNEKDIQQQQQKNQQSNKSPEQQRERHSSGATGSSPERNNSPQGNNSAQGNNTETPSKGKQSEPSSKSSQTPESSSQAQSRNQPTAAPTQMTTPPAQNVTDQQVSSAPPDQQSSAALAMQAPAPLSEQEREELKVQWQQRLAGAAQQAQQAGKLGGAMARLVDHLLQPQLPWRSLLAHYVTCSARDDYSYVRPNTRRGNPAIFPGLRSEEVNIAVVLDSSGSIKPQEMREFLSEINAIKSQIRARIIFHACDASMAADGPWIFDAWQEFTLPKSISGGGATDFRPAFDWVRSLDVQPSLLVYFTDAEGEFPEQCPPYPVIWLVKGRLPVPWGQRVQLN